MRKVPFDSFDDRAALIGRGVRIHTNYGAVFSGVLRERLGNWVRIDGREFPNGRLWILLRTIAEVWAVEVDDVQPARRNLRKRRYELQPTAKRPAPNNFAAFHAQRKLGRKPGYRNGL